MKRMLWGVTLALALSVPTTALAEPSEQTVRQVHALLQAPEYEPTAADWQRIGPDAAEVLRDVALDKKTLVSKRGRAAVSLMHFKGDASKQTLITLVSDQKAYWLVRGKAARSLATTYQQEALQHIAPLMDHKSLRMREAGIKAVGRVVSNESVSMLKARLGKERSAHLKSVIQAAIKRAGGGQ